MDTSATNVLGVVPLSTTDVIVPLVCKKMRIVFPAVGLVLHVAAWVVPLPTRPRALICPLTMLMAYPPYESWTVVVNTQEAPEAFVPSDAILWLIRAAPVPTPESVAPGVIAAVVKNQPHSAQAKLPFAEAKVHTPWIVSFVCDVVTRVGFESKAW